MYCGGSGNGVGDADTADTVAAAVAVSADTAAAHPIPHQCRLTPNNTHAPTSWDSPTNSSAPNNAHQPTLNDKDQPIPGQPHTSNTHPFEPRTHQHPPIQLEPPDTHQHQHLRTSSVHPTAIHQHPPASIKPRPTGTLPQKWRKYHIKRHRLPTISSQAFAISASRSLAAWDSNCCGGNDCCGGYT